VKRLAAQEKVDRDRQVVADCLRGLTWATIAQRHGLSERHCREIVEQWRVSQPALDQLDPLELIQEALERRETLIEEFALLAEGSNHEAVRLGALKARHAALIDYTGLLIACGLLPPSLGQAAVEIDVHRLTQHILDVFDRYGVDEAARRDLVELLRGGTGARPWSGQTQAQDGASTSATRGIGPAE
jgi:hypothetical protein